MSDLPAIRTLRDAVSRELADLEERMFGIIRRRQVYMLEAGEERRRHVAPPACRDCPQNRRKG